MSHMNTRSSSNSASSWDFIWATKVPSEVKTFVCKACKNALPTAVNLRQRNIGFLECCPVCYEDEEDTSHVLLHCSFGRQVWALSNLPWRIISDCSSDVETWMRKIATFFSGEHMDLFMIICWSLWLRRNRKIFENISIGALEVVMFARNYHNSITRKPPTLPPATTRWTPPGEGWIKLNFNGVVFKDRKEIGVGVIARDASGFCLALCSRTFPFLPEAKVAEAVAARIALHLAAVMGWSNIQLEGDSLYIIRKIEAAEVDLYSPVGPIIYDIRAFSRNFTSFKVNFVGRDANEVAHLLAESSLIFQQSGSSTLPLEVQALISFDLGNYCH